MNARKLYLLGILVGLAVAGGLALIIRNRSGVPAPALDAGLFAAWVEVAPENGLFSARLPSAPQESHNSFPVPDSTETVVQDIYTVKDEQGNVYFISAAVYPVAFDPAKNEEALRGALDGMVGALPGGTLLSSQLLDFKGQTSLDFVIQDANKILHQGKLLIKGRILYQAFVSYEEGALEEEEYYYFLESFNLL